MLSKYIYLIYSVVYFYDSVNIVNFNILRNNRNLPHTNNSEIKFNINITFIRNASVSSLYNILDNLLVLNEFYFNTLTLKTQKSPTNSSFVDF